MRCSLRHCLLTSLAVGFLWLFLTLQIPRDMDEDQNKVHALLSSMPPVSDGGKKAPRPPGDWQDLTSTYMKTIQQRRKTWLTVGISSGPGRDPNGLLYTLGSLFRASSKVEQRHLTVLVHLADSDFAWLRETVVRISSLFSPQILAGRLVLIHAPPDAYSAAGPAGDQGAHCGDGDQGARCGGASAKQNADHAFLVSFAAKLSDYFLLLRDNVFCAPSFLTHVRRKVWALRAHPWALLEFSNRGSLGKLFRGGDLPRLARFLLLFQQDQPLSRLIPRFSVLQAQRRPVLCRPFLFYYRVSYYRASQDPKARAAQSRGPPGPHNPPGAVFTDMRVFDVHAPWEAYTLDESFFWTHNVSAGSHLTVVLNRPANLSRVQVLTGTVVEGKHALQRGQVELGHSPEGVPQFCTSFVLLGQLLEGQLDQEALPTRVGSDVSCVKLVVNADQAGGLMVRHIYLWEEGARATVAAQG
ncbi:alpha-1,3-mannosyl-glycoprotein 4-beta-N-acetylglucosaminyltransferase-like protein MGAT4E [Eptesicus fuscus]|uniref:alpha-1,3-mannosyl-glycoprotein 4-beta-N-acetylglucosaminyltransferase-like protein MGAT4E n=1 Tax=Eptesicus fuscus TaxID=29078 RepID=UPI002403B95F|nr:alpha-1,3-mannosyl-glycoprotein 4-beta-N-acetylglucosaminyltransferase-like protein MGAT4E [Eptesicus fuscus]